MRRREFISLAGSTAVVWPLATRAQQPSRLWRIGFLAGASRPVSLESSLYNGFSEGMRTLGYAEGKDFVIEWRFAEGRFDLLPALAAELVRLNVDVIVVGTPVAVRPAQQATRTIPIVMAISTDPVGQGFVTSLAHPEGNITGLANSMDDIIQKQLELLRLAVPNLTRVGVIVNPKNSVHSTILNITAIAAERLGVALLPTRIATADELPKAFATLVNERPDGALVVADSLFSSQRQRIAELATIARLPTIFGQREYVEAGGLMSYGESIYEFLRRSAFYVDKLLKGSKPADLPIQQPTQFLLVINRKAAAAIGLTLAPNLLALADDVIE